MALTNAEATPAILPCGSMASALKLGKTRPTKSIPTVIMTKNDQNDSNPVRLKKNWVPMTTVKQVTARWLSRRMPSRSTSCALMNVAIDSEATIAANT